MNKILSWLVSKFLRPVLVNWKTTFLGILALIPSIRAVAGDLEGALNLLVNAANGDTLDVGQLKLLVGGIGSIVGTALVFAKDGNKSTEASTGVSPPKALPVYEK